MSLLSAAHLADRARRLALATVRHPIGAPLPDPDQPPPVGDDANAAQWAEVDTAIAELVPRTFGEDLETRSLADLYARYRWLHLSMVRAGTMVTQGDPTRPRDVPAEPTDDQVRRFAHEVERTLDRLLFRVRCEIERRHDLRPGHEVRRGATRDATRFEAAVLDPERPALDRETLTAQIAALEVILANAQGRVAAAVQALPKRTEDATGEVLFWLHRARTEHAAVQTRYAAKVLVERHFDRCMAARAQAAALREERLALGR